MNDEMEGGLDRATGTTGRTYASASVEECHQEVVAAPSTPHSCEFTGQEAAA